MTTGGSNTYQFGPFRLEPSERLLLRDGQVVSLTPKAFDLLVYLVEHQGRLVEKSTLMAALWPDTIVEEANLAFQVSALRKALEDGAEGEPLIQTVPTRGYRFVVPVTRTTMAGRPPAQPIPTRVRVAGAILIVSLVGAGGIWWLNKVHRDRTADQVQRLPSQNLTRLTFDPGLQTDVAWSPDGQSIAYASDKTGNFDIWVQKIDSGEAVRLTKSLANDTQPAWSPDGSTIAFRSERDGGGLFAVPANTGPERRLSSFGWAPHWSPDSSLVLFAGSNLLMRDVPHQLFTVSLDGAKPEPVMEKFLTEHANSVIAWNWYSDSEHVSILTSVPGGDSSISTFSLRDGSSFILKLPAGGGCWNNFDWRASGATLLIERCNSGTPNVWRLDLSGPSGSVVSAKLLTGGLGWAPNIAISPDGTRAALPRVTKTSRVWIVPFNPVDGTIENEGEPLTDADVIPYSHALSPDGTKWVYTLIREGTSRDELWVMDLTTRKSRRLAADAHHRFCAQWSPDSRRLAYRWTHQVSETDRDEALAVWNLDTGEEQLVGSGTKRGAAAVFPCDWSPDGNSVLASSSIPKPPNMSLGLWPLASAPHAERKITALAWAPDFDLGEGEARFSPNGRWIVFIAVNLRAAGASTIEVIPAAGAPSSQWTRLTLAEEWADKPRWASDGKAVYFTLVRNSHWNVWGTRFDDVTGRPIGEPYQITHFDSVQHQLSNYEGAELGVAARRLVMTIQEQTGSIWMVDNLSR